MPLSYFDIGSTDTAFAPRDVAQGAADALQQQQAEHLAVTPAVSLRDAVQRAQTRQRLQQGVALGATRNELGAQQVALGSQRVGLGEREVGLAQRRLGLAQGAQQYAVGQVPWEIAAGAVSGATKLYGGYRAQQDQAQSADVQRQMLALQQQQGQQGLASATSLVAASRNIQRLLESQGYPSYGPYTFTTEH